MDILYIVIYIFLYRKTNRCTRIRFKEYFKKYISIFNNSTLLINIYTNNFLCPVCFWQSYHFFFESEKQTTDVEISKSVDIQKMLFQLAKNSRKQKTFNDFFQKSKNCLGLFFGIN